ncbi:MAG: hypothetical protein ACR2JD_08070 [Nocardioides sp.]
MASARTRPGHHIRADLRAGGRPARGTAGRRREQDLVEEDPDDFADRLAEAHAVPLSEPPPQRLPTARAVVTVGLAAALAGGAVSWLFLLPLSYPLLDSAVGNPVSEVGSILVVYLFLGAFTVASAAVAIGWSFRADPRTPRLLRFVTPGIALFGIASVAPNMGLAALFGYSTAASAVILEAILVAAFVGSGIWLGHWASLPRGAGHG